MNGSELSKVSHENVSRVTINNDLNPRKHCSDVVKKTNNLVGYMGRNFEYKSEIVIPTQFNALVVHPHLECCIHFWSPYYKKKY